MEHKKHLLKSIPKVDECISWIVGKEEIESAPLVIVKNCVREELALLRQAILTGGPFPAEQLEQENVVHRIVRKVKQKQQYKFRRVINGTGVIIHTNLGRSLLSRDTMDRLVIAGSYYGNLEFDLATGKRGSRYSLVEELLCELTGAEAGLVVNNNAAAVLIALETLAKEREVVVSRGQLVEIGGSFRIPDVMARSGARLVEVGATNRTHLRDYEGALNEHTALLLKVHCSNYRIIGFTGEVTLEELVALGGKHSLPVMEDLGSGSFIDLSQFGLKKEPTVQEVVRAGTDIVTFSGDKLLGGPQAGIILGRKTLIDKIKKNPLNRAVRIDKFTLAGLESILRIYLDPQKAVKEIPTLAMISAPVTAVAERAEKLLGKLGDDVKPVCQAEIRPAFSRVGGGAMPEQDIESRAVVLSPVRLKISRLEILLRDLDVPVIGRVEDESLYLDMRTVGDDDIELLAVGLRHVLLSHSS